MQKRKLIVLGLIRNNKGQFLISQRFDPDVPDAHLKWDLVGGTNEPGESLKKTLRREVREETGLDVEIQELLPQSVSKIWDYRGSKLQTTVFCYKCKLIGGSMHLNDHKINNLKWVTRDELVSYEFLSTAKVFIDLVV